MGILSNSITNTLAKWMSREKPKHTEPQEQKPVEEKRTYKRRVKRRPKFTLDGNKATLSMSKTQYLITPKGWRRLTHKTSKKRIKIQERRAA